LKASRSRRLRDNIVSHWITPLCNSAEYRPKGIPLIALSTPRSRSTLNTENGRLNNDVCGLSTQRKTDVSAQ